MRQVCAPGVLHYSKGILVRHTITEREGSAATETGPSEAKPGLLLVFSINEARIVTVPIPAQSSIELGRDELVALGVHDARVSRRHLRGELRGGRFWFRDLGSTNGSWLDGQPLGAEPSAGRTEPDPGAPSAGAAHVVRIGRTLLLALDDVTPMERHGVSTRSGVVMGPLLQRAHDHIGVLARAGESLLITGESGTGKELAVRAYHTASGRTQGPLIAVNCATLPRELAERLLFGARRGAYSGAVADSEGFIQAADQGTLFLDEIAELDPLIQAKLLRVLETREVTQLGAVRARPVDLQVCAATLRDLSAEVAAGRFREDLYFRIGRPAIALPPLRQRPEEIPLLIAHALSTVPGQSVPASAAFVEACLLRPWPGNVRELCVEVRAAALLARSEGASELVARHLGGRAGWPPGSQVMPAADVGKEGPAPEQIARVLAQVGGNLSAAAQRLGMPRTTLRRLMAREGLDAAGFRGGRPPDEGEPA